MNVFADFVIRVREAVAALAGDGALPEGLDLERVSVEAPREAGHGDLATNAAMVLARQASMKPRDIAEKLAAVLAADADVEDVEVAGPGFVNITLNIACWHGWLKAMLAAGAPFPHEDIGQDKAINVEYVSANPTGPLHVGHCRGAVFGDALSNLLARTGFAVTREYYINDAGAQVDALARSAYLRYREALGEKIGKIGEGLYPGAYLRPVGKALAEEHGASLLDAPEGVWLAPVRQRAIEMMMQGVRADLAALGIHHDVFFSERSLTEEGADLIAAAIAYLRDKGVIYEGRLPPPKGQPPEDWEDREQTLFRATRFGDDIDRPLMKSDGSYTYFAADIAYHLDKFRRGFSSMIDVWGADHGGYVKRMKAAAAAITGGKGALDIKICQLVRLLRAGEPVKMSKRAGEFVTLRDVVDEVGPDCVRFMMLFRKNDAPLDFDFVAVTEQSRDNPVFYVQYAHARAHSVLRNAADALPDLDVSPASLAGADLSRLTDAGETGLIKRLAEYPRVVAAAAQAHEPHRVAFYLHELASDFHALWNRGKDLPQLRFINAEDPPLTRARVGLVRALALVVADGLGILGVTAVEEMR
jgi:arginyl-tRNA synthetase